MFQVGATGIEQEEEEEEEDHDQAITTFFQTLLCSLFTNNPTIRRYIVCNLRASKIT
jgi:hypothetical protein